MIIKERNLPENMRIRLIKVLSLIAFVIILGVASRKNVRADIASGTSGTCSWVIDDDGVLTISPTDGVSGTLASYTGGSGPFYNYRDNITKVVVENGVKTNRGCVQLFACLTACTEMDLSGLDTSNAEYMMSMFDSSDALISINFGNNFNTSNVESMSYMFYNCKALTSLNLGNNFDTSNVIDMNCMFSGCKALTSLDLGNNFDTSNVTSVNNTFRDCESLTSLDLGNEFDTSNVTNMKYMFHNCKSLSSLDLGDKFDTSNVTNMESMFYDCNALASLNLGNKFDTGNVTDMKYMFAACQLLASLDLGDKFDTSNVTSMYCTFNDCESLTSLDLGNSFDTSNVTNMNNMFSYCESLTTLDLGDKFDTDNVMNMGYMFCNCKALTSLNLGNNFKTSSVTNMNNMFSYCESLTTLDLGDNFDTSSVTNMSSMFCGCIALASLDLKEKFNTSNVTNMINMFINTSKLSSIILDDEFSFKGNGSASCTLQAPLSSQDGIEYTGKWIRSDKSYGPYTPEELRDNYTPAMAGEWVWEEVPSDFTIQFTKNQADAIGAMESVTTKATQPYTIPSNLFKKFGYVFDHWDDGNGHTYENKGTIPANTYTAGTTITLTAVLVPRNTMANLQNGEMDIMLMGNEKATFDNIPAGTAYQIFEETPNGWVLIEQSGSSGIIEPLQTSSARFTNQYQPDKTTIQFSGTKTLDGQAASEGSYSFILKEDDTIIDETEVKTGGFIQFDIIEYEETDIGEHTYTITEVDPDDDRIIYDRHKETVTVNVSKVGDQLTAVATYDSDGIVFRNTTKPGILKITKQTEGQTDANEDDEFSFNINLTNGSGQPIGADGQIYWYKESA